MSAQFSFAETIDEVHGEIRSESGHIFEVADGGDILLFFLEESGQYF